MEKLPINSYWVLRLFVLLIILISLFDIWLFSVAENDFQILAAFATLAVASTAIFKEKIYDWILKPNITISVSNEYKDEVVAASDPKSTKICIIGQMLEGQNLKSPEREIWSGITIENVGLGSARNVEVYFNGIFCNKKDIVFKRHKALPLRKGWTGGTRIERLHKGLRIRWDVCRIYSSKPKKIRFELEHVPIALDEIIWNDKEPLIFKFDIVAVADNIEPQTTRMQITFKGKYDEGFKMEAICRRVILE